jgi:cell division protein FtsL
MKFINKQSANVICVRQASGHFAVYLYILAALVMVSYIVVVNYTNTLGYEIGEMNRNISKLEKEYRDLQNVATGLQSIDRIEQISNQQLNMVSAGKIDYVSANIKPVAINK